MRSEARARGLFAVTFAMMVVAMSGCVSANVAPTVVSYNLSVEQAQNEMLLLNAVRAAKWQPMYVTDVAKVTGSIRRDLSATLAVPFSSLHHGTGANDSGGSGVTFSVNPTFEINTLNTTDFMKGFCSPSRWTGLPTSGTRTGHPSFFCICSCMRSMSCEPMARS